MLGSRTKQVYSYGKRNQRIVTAPEGSTSEPAKSSFNIFTDAPPLAPVVNKMRKRESVVPTKSRLSPKVVNAQKKKKLSPLLSPMVKKRTRLRQQDDRNSSPAQKSTKLNGKVISSPARLPFSPFTLNNANSRTESDVGKVVKPIPITPSNVADVDAIVLDVKMGDSRLVESDSDSDVVTLAVIRKRNRLNKRPATRLVPSDSDSEPELTQNEPRPIVVPLAPKPKERPQPSATLPSQPLYGAPSGLLREAVAVSRPSPTSPSKPSDNNLAAPRPSKPATRMEKSVAPTVQIIDLTNDDEDEEDPCESASKWTETVIFTSPVRIIRPPPPRYQHIASPIVRARQVTPIRRSGDRGYVPPSPSTGSEFDLDLELSNLNLSDDEPTVSQKPPTPEYLLPLLEECGQASDGPYEFSAFINTFPLDPVVQPSEGPSKISFCKIGEASYSEVFGIGAVVLKIVPLRDELFTQRPVANPEDDDDDDDGPASSDAKDVLKEIVVTRAMGDICDGFVDLIRAYVVRGRYPELLLELWDEFFKTKGSESIRPDMFGPSQCYAIIVLPNGGPDLEHYSFSNTTKTGWRKATSLFWQVSKALAHAEQLVSFEHRDLHWGQILVKNVMVPPAAVSQPRAKSPEKAKMDDKRNGVSVTLIDLGLSRMDAGDGRGGERVHWTPFEEEIFMGEGEYQFDIYRLMRDYVLSSGSSWEDFNPCTNIMWLHYLAVKLIKFKGLKAPAIPRKSTGASAAYFTERECYECLIEVEKHLRVCIHSMAARAKPIGKGRARKAATTSADSIGLQCAGELVVYAVKRGWIHQNSSPDPGYVLT